MPAGGSRHQKNKRISEQYKRRVVKRDTSMAKQNSTFFKRGRRGKDDGGKKILGVLWGGSTEQGKAGESTRNARGKTRQQKKKEGSHRKGGGCFRLLGEVVEGRGCKDRATKRVTVKVRH